MRDQTRCRKGHSDTFHILKRKARCHLHVDREDRETRCYWQGMRGV